MQFHLSTIFLAAVVIATSLAMGSVGWVITALVVIAILAGPQRFVVGLATLATIVLVSNCLIAYHPPARESARRSACRNNLKYIAIGLHNYHDAYGVFPPACVLDKDGMPTHSWRTLVLPFIDESPLYQRYRFDEPWNGPNNAAMTQLRPRVYACPSDSDIGQERTSYVAVLGPMSLWRKRLPASTQNLDKIVMVYEWTGSSIPWAEPRDLRREDFTRWLQTLAGPNDGHQSGVNVAFADGSVRFLSWDDPVELARTVFGDELTEEERQMLEEYVAERERQIRWRTLINYATLIAWLASIVVMVVHLRAIRRKPTGPAESATA